MMIQKNDPARLPPPRRRDPAAEDAPPPRLRPRPRPQDRFDPTPFAATTRAPAPASSTSPRPLPPTRATGLDRGAVTALGMEQTPTAPTRVTRGLTQRPGFDPGTVTPQQETPRVQGPETTQASPQSTTRTQAQRVVEEAYQDLLLRAPDPEGMKTHLALAHDVLRDGGTPQEAQEAVEASIKQSDEYQVIDRVNRSFENVLGRTPTEKGYWHDEALKMRAEGKSIDEIGATLEAAHRQSDEYLLQHPEEIVKGLYSELLGREPDPEGLSTWTAEAKLLAMGGKLPAEIRAIIGDKIKASAEYQELEAARRAESEPAQPTGGDLSDRIMSRAEEVGDAINDTGGYRFDGENDCWGFVRRTVDPILAEQGLPPLPTADAGTPEGAANWDKVTDWSQVPVGTPVSTHEGHAWGDQWHGGIFAGMKDGVPHFYDCSSSTGGASMRPLNGVFAYAHAPTMDLLRQDAASSPAPPSGPQATSDIASPAGPEWANVNRWDGAVLDAVAQVEQETGVRVPPNLLKAMMRLESGGDETAVTPTGNPDGPYAIGLLQVVPGLSYGTYDAQRMRDDPTYQIYAGARDLVHRFQDPRNQHGWDGAIRGYFSGNYEPNDAQDVIGTSTNQYYDRITSWWSELGR